jgi:undecaprenyl diphosphate synthase
MNKVSDFVAPIHVGFIMDGNRRWAKERGLSPMKGHEAGVDVFHTAVRTCFDNGVKYVSAYTFSTENWARAKDEVKFLMGLVTKVLKKYLHEFHKDNIRIVVLGSRDKLAQSVIRAIDEAESTTRNNTAGTVALCFNYGGLPEIADMVRSIVSQNVDTQELTGADIQKYLYHPEVPPCDLIVRVSGEKRLSGFMLARSEYAEFIFDDPYWPDITAEHVLGYLAEYSNRQRRFGS